jgi:hypothetical protein
MDAKPNERRRNELMARGAGGRPAKSFGDVASSTNFSSRFHP